MSIFKREAGGVFSSNFVSPSILASRFLELLLLGASENPRVWNYTCLFVFFAPEDQVATAIKF